MTEQKFTSFAKQAVADHRNNRLGDKPAISKEDVTFVWFNYTIGNMKCLAITNDHDKTYYEVTYHKEREAVYLDFYEKQEHLELKAN